MRILSGTSLFIGVLLSGIMFLPSLHAANDQRGLIVSPAFQEIVLDQKDKEQDFVVSVSNDTDVSATLYLSVLDFGSLDESGGVAFLGASSDLEKKYSLASWMRLEKDTLTLAQGETGEVRVTIENRDSLGPGGHYGALTFKTGDDASPDGTGSTISVNQLFTTLVFVKKVGGEIYDLKFNGQEYESNIVKFQDTIRLRLENSGNVHLVPRGIVSVTDPFGRIVGKGIINQESTLILPETLRVYPVRLEKLAMSFVPGRYTMEIAYRYDGKDDFVTTSLQFDFIPPAAIVTFLVLGAAFGWYAVRWRRHMGEKNALAGSGKPKHKDV
ncbi:MAG: hypothetical protein Q8O53_00235 [Candidatus Moranbacteria bacterium]|nr:hypothetical protein [Candidatus Moranbacteria bacterium]